MTITLNTLVTFDGLDNGAFPYAGLISDAAGDLFGTTQLGGQLNYGTVFEIANTASGYGAPVTLATFDGLGNGAFPTASLISDAAGDLFGTTYNGGANSDGTVFEIANTVSGYGAPVTLATFNGTGNGASPTGGLIRDAAGDLFGTTTYGGQLGYGTVFEIANTASGYGAPVTLVTFDGLGNGAYPTAGLISDAAGDLFGTTSNGGAHSDGTVFEIANTASGYGAPVTLATFDGVDNGAFPHGGLISDAAGDLFGTTENGGADSNGTVFEIAKTASGYGAPVTLATFDGLDNGAFPYDGLISDAAGDLFGTTENGGTNSNGTVFEIAKTASGYGAPVTLVTFNGLGNGAFPFAGLISDAAGDLFGTTNNGGTNSDGTVFEITGSGFVAAPPPDDFNGDGTSDILYRNDAGGDTGFYQMNNGASTGWHDIGATSTAYSIVGVGDFTGSGTSDILFRDNAAAGDTGFYQMVNGVNTGWHDIGATSNAYSVVGIGDFTGLGTDDILFRNNASGGDTGFFQMVNGANAGWHDVGATSTAYSVVGTGDFTGGGTDDILFRDNAAGGDTGFFQMVNGDSNGWHDIGATSTAYSVVGIGDFTGSRTDDILFRDNAAGGDTGFYQMVNGINTGWHDIGATSTAYSVVGIGDFTGSGTEDILFRNDTTGDTGFYQMINGANAGWHDIGASSTAYHVVS